MGGFKSAITKYAQFSDRARRKEFWGFILVSFLISVVISALFGVAVGVGGNAGTVLLWIAWAAMVLTGLALLCPYLAVSWRRYQDVGLHGAVSIVGWFFPIVTIIVAFVPGKVGPNEYGLDPKAQQ